MKYLNMIQNIDINILGMVNKKLILTPIPKIHQIQLFIKLYT